MTIKNFYLKYCLCVCVQLVGGEGLVSAVHEDGFRRHLLCNAV